MNYSIRGEHIEVTEALRDYVEKKVSRLGKYFETPPTTEVNVKLSVVKGAHVVEVSLPLPGLMLRAEMGSEDMYASIDLVIDKLERQIRKHKTRVNRKLRQVGGLRTLLKESFESIPTRYSEDEDEFEVVRTKRFTLKPMDIDEAILQMNMIGHTFFVFSNSSTDEVSVVYKRNDGKYGLIEPAY